MRLSETDRPPCPGRASLLTMVDGMAGCHWEWDIDMDGGGDTDVDDLWPRLNMPRRESVLGAKLGVKLGAKLGVKLGA